MKNDRFWELLARKMSGEISSGELEELDYLLRTNPHLHFSIQAIADLWNYSATRLQTADNQQNYEKLLKKMQQSGIKIESADFPNEASAVLLEGSRKPPVRRLFWAAAAILVLVFSGWGLFYSGKSENKEVSPLPEQEATSEVSTKYGSKTRVQLPDGSQVWLNAGSKLNYNKDFGKTIREVQLIGEGFFDVVKNPRKPFVIHTSAIDIRVLGTQFNVRSYPGDKTSETSLVRGSVEVVVRKRPDEKYILKPNEKIVVLNEDSTLPPQKANPIAKSRIARDPIIAIRKLTYKPGDSVAVETAWAYNKLSFEDESFADVARKMERWYDVRFEFRNSQLEDIRLQGSFINETLPQAMEALKYTNRFRYEIKNNRVIVY